MTESRLRILGKRGAGRGPGIAHLREYILGERKEISAALEEKLSLLRVTYALSMEGYNKEERIRILVELHKIPQSSAYLLDNNAIELFGDIAMAARLGELHVRYESLIRLAKRAEEKGNLPEAIRANALAADLLLKMGPLVPTALEVREAATGDVKFTHKLKEAEEAQEGGQS
jgi:hypothetical protein